MIALIEPEFFPRTRVRDPRIPPGITAIIASFLLVVIPLLAGCGGGDGDPAFTATGASVSLAWHPVPDPSVSAYFVHYGRQSSDQPGVCEYENSISVDSPSATVTNLDPDTRYYFAVNAYNGLESACSNEVSTVTPSVQADQRGPSNGPEAPIITRDSSSHISDMSVMQRPQ